MLQSSRWGLLVGVALLGCAERAPQMPEPETPDPPPPPPPAQPSEAEATEPEPQPNAFPEPDKEEEPISKPTRPAAEIMLETDTDFLFDYSASAPKIAADAKCSAGEEEPSPQEKAECLRKAREDFKADVLSFRRVGETMNARWVIYQRRGNALSEMFSGPVVLEDTSETMVKVKVQGKGKGYRTIFPMEKEFNAQIPDDYTLILEDPRLGKLLYRAKIGLVTR